MKSNYLFKQRNYPLPRTAIEAEILFAARIMQVRFLGAVIKPVHPCTGLRARFAQQNALLLRTTDIRVGTEKKTPREQNRSGKKIGAVWCSGADRRSFEASAVLHFVFFEVIVNKMQQSAKESCLLKRKTVPEVFPLTIGSGKTMPFEKRHAGCEEREKINRRRIYDTLRINFFEATKQTACIFSKGEMDEETGLYYYGARYLDPKYSRWLSGDPALSDYIPTAGTDPSKLAGMEGVYNTVNLHLYHYAGNNPVKYTDPTGMFDDVSESCKNFIKNYEGGFHPKIYDAEDPSNEYKKGKAGDWTIGYGHKLTANDLSSGIYDNGIKKDDASKLFDKDLKSSVDAVNRDLPNADKLTQNQFDALVDFTYNIGSGDGFKNSKVKVAVEKYGDKIANSETMQTDDYKINIADVFRHHIPPRTSPINKGIKNRRYNEVQMFLYGDYQRDDTPPGIASGWQEGIKI